MTNCYLSIEHFGPLKSVEIHFNRFTVFIGPQGSGKSTIAKLYSTFLWMEKRLVRDLVTISYFESPSVFSEKLAAYHRIESYFHNDTVITFKGHNYLFDYRDGRLSVSPLDTEDAAVVKVMYVPSERNYLSSMRNINGLKSLPESLYTFKEEYDRARERFYSGLKLPIENVSFEYDKLTNIAWLVGEDYRVKLTDASSGFQAVTPLLLVSQYLTDVVSASHTEENKRLSIEEWERLRASVQEIIDNHELSSEVKEAALASISRKYTYAGLVNIVEEPEENLYPSSQRNVLYSLLSLASRQSGNELILTTHSPYIINFLTLAIKAWEVKEKGGNEEQIDEVVPVAALISGKEVQIYQLERGYAKSLATYNGLPSDSNDLNNS